ncbi:MAG: peroxidase family protein, partial [Vicinamibacteria bacterium]
MAIAKQPVEAIHPGKAHEDAMVVASQTAGTNWQEVYLGGSPEAEADIVQAFVSDIKRVQAQIKTTAKASEIRRAFHAKMHLGVTNAEFRILPDIPPELCVGFFRPGAKYKATVRLSNASGEIKADSASDFRGIAIRIHAGKDHVHDLLMTNAPASHARDAVQFMTAAKALSSRPKALAPFRLIFGLGPFEAVRMLFALIGGASRKVYSMATESFWSRAPIRFGPYAAKYSIKPVPETKPVSESEIDDIKKRANFLRDDLLERLLEGDVAYDFRVQRYVNPKKTPIEDGVVEWKESEAPPETIARLVIPKQDRNSAEARSEEAFVQRLEFNPFNTTDDFRPLGSLNRARKLVYQTSADHREGRVSYVPVGFFGRFYDWFTEKGYNLLNTVVPWHKLPVLLGLGNLLAQRNVLRRENLHDTEEREIVPTARPNVRAMDPSLRGVRTSDGTHNDLSQPRMGAAGARFGRNIPLHKVVRDTRLLEPNPLVVSRELMTRHVFQPATTLNMLAAAWIQFQIHGWFNHKRRKDKFIELTGYGWQEKPMRVRETSPETPTKTDPNMPPTYANEETHWWDGSQMYGTTRELVLSLRERRGGKLAIEKDGLLRAENGIDVTAFNENWWIGLSMMHTLFTLEHNAICDRLHREYPSWDDDLLFEKAHLINAALMAKIHTVEWTPAIVAHPTLQVAMNANWWGLLGEGLAKSLGRVGDGEVWSGIMGSPPDHHAAPYSLTEEFVAVYRMHPLMPDDFAFHSHEDHRFLGAEKLEDVQGPATRKVVESVGMRNLFYSFGIAHPGAITLHNYPHFLQRLVRRDEEGKEEKFDLAAVDVLRDRERGVPRYNDFREILHLPRIRSFKRLTKNPVWALEIRKVYNDDIDDVDLMVGMFAETPPKGFG